MKKIFAGGAAALLALGLASFATMPANAVESQTDSCIPSEAWTETITDTPESTIPHEAVTHTEFQRYSYIKQNDNEGDPSTNGSTPITDAGNWNSDNKPNPGDDPIGSAFQKGNGNGSWFFWTSTVVVDTEAYDEVVPAVTHDVVHDAVVCDEPEGDVTETYTWQLPDGGTSTNVTWPQTLVGIGDIETPACGVTYQVDTYTGTRAEIDAVVGDGVLEGNPPEDSGIVTDWHFHAGPACDEEPPTYQPTCTTVTGSETITGDGVLTVEGDWDETTISVPFSGTLADIGTVLDIDASPLQYVGLHIHTAEGTIVFEEEASYNGQLWSNSAWAGVNPGLGYAALGTIEEYIHLNGDVAVTGIDLLYTSPEASSTTVDSFVIGCTSYVFEPADTEEPPTTEPPVVTPPVVEPPVVVTPVVPAALVAAPVAADSLASTGAEVAGFVWGAGILLGLGIIITAFLGRRKATN